MSAACSSPPTSTALLPRYLRFVSGVVDSEDLQLNVSRETLQHGAVIAKMRKALVRRLLDELAAKAKAGAGRGRGRPRRAKRRELRRLVEPSSARCSRRASTRTPTTAPKLLELARFRSTHGQGWTSLADYVARMKEGQEAIYYISGESHDALRTSPQLEQALAKGVEVLLLDDPVDEFWLQEVKDYQSHAAALADPRRGRPVRRSRARPSRRRPRRRWATPSSSG